MKISLETLVRIFSAFKYNKHFSRHLIYVRIQLSIGLCQNVKWLTPGIVDLGKRTYQTFTQAMNQNLTVLIPIENFAFEICEVLLNIYNE